MRLDAVERVRHGQSQRAGLVQSIGARLGVRGAACMATLQRRRLQPAERQSEQDERVADAWGPAVLTDA
jgi:hypothetical protein